MRPTPDKSRLTTVESLYFTGPLHAPVVVDSRFSIGIQNDESPYQKRIRMTQEWVRLPVPEYLLTTPGFPRIHSYLVLTNLGDIVPKSTIPTKDEQDSIERQIVEVSLRPIIEPDILVFPKESVRLVPRVTDNLWVRCLEPGACFLAVSLFPG